jgi:multiple RNA-binding domain-containing protein 1
LCKSFGPIAETHIPVDPQSKRGVGLAFVTYMIPENAVQAMTSLDGTIFLGRLLHVLPALPQKTSEPLVAGRKQTFKEKKQQKQKENANDSVNWSSLFMRSSAVVDSLAERYSASKGDLIGPEAENQAVRLAMMETHIINETKQVLAEEGVAVEAFAQLNDKTKRSDTVILVKNIPYTTTVEELTLLFGQYGRLGRVVLPPAKTLALVEYLEPNDAKKVCLPKLTTGFPRSVLQKVQACATIPRIRTGCSVC